MATISFERLPGESKKAYEAFTLYRDMGYTRSIQKVAQKLTKSDALLRRWSSQYQWVERANAFDDEMDRKARAEMEAKHKEMKLKEFNITYQLFEKLEQASEKMKPEAMTPNEIKGLFEIALKAARLGRGESTEISEVTHSGEVNEKHEYNIFQRVDQYSELYKKLAQRGTTSSIDESDDH